MNRKAKIGLMQENSVFLNKHQLWRVPLKGDDFFMPLNGTTRYKKCKQLFEYQHLLLLRDIW
jgi:hypothetical protein